MKIDILNKDVIHNIIYEINSFQNKQRKEKEWDAYQIKEGMLREYVKAELKRLFPKNHSKMRVSDVNITKKVIDKISKAYSIPPKREIPGATEEVNTSLNNIYKNGEFNCAYRNFDWILNLHKYGLFWVNYDSDLDNYYPMSLKPFEYDIIRDQNNGELECVILSYPGIEITTHGVSGSIPASISDGINQLIQESQFDSGAENKVYALWNNENHVVVVWSKKKIVSATKVDYQYSVTYVPIDGNPNNINPLGVINFVYKQKGDAIDYPVKNPITDQSINYNVIQSDILTASTMQGFGQGVLKYPAGAEILEQEVGYMTAIKLPQDTTPDSKETSFQFENPSPNLEGWQKIILTYLKQVLAEHGINSAQSIDGETEKYASGLDRLIASADVQWIIQENQEIYLELENNVFEIVKAWESLKGNKEFTQFDEIKVIYQKPTVQISDSEKLNNIKMLLDMGLVDKEGALQILDPNLSVEQAKEKIASFNAPNEAVLRLISNNKPQNNKEDTDTSGQLNG